MALYPIVVGLLTCFVFWLISPTLDRLRDKWRVRAAKAPLTPENEATMLKQLRMQQASLKRLEQFRSSTKDALLYVNQLLGAGLLFFVTAVYLYPFRVETQGVCILPAATSILFFVIALVEGRNVTDKRIDVSVVSLTKSIEDAKDKLKLAD